jgi:Sulfotransferase family
MGLSVALPHFLCVGAQKAGTTWMYRMLSQHPGVWMPVIKELHYFDYLYIKGNRKLAEAIIRGGINKSMLRHVRYGNTDVGRNVDYKYLRYLIDIGSQSLFTEEWYRRIFDRPQAKGKVIGEITPAYCLIPLEGVQHVHRLLSGVRIIYLIRDPRERALSQLKMLVKRRGGPPSSAEEWRALASGSGLEARGDYAQSVPLWRSVFPPEQLLFLPYGDISADPMTVLGRIESFIGLKPLRRYRKLGARVHESDPVSIPDFVVDFVSRQMQRQEGFLKSAFGDDFAARTRDRTKAAETANTALPPSGVPIRIPPTAAAGLRSDPIQVST